MVKAFTKVDKNGGTQDNFQTTNLPQQEER
jgi:hypothetical protein